MEVLVAENCGFCPGVRNAIRVAQEILAERGRVFSLGPVIHNKDMVDRLAEAGLVTVEDIEDVEEGTVLIRSHGAAPAQIERLKERDLKIVDATCVLVKRLQHIARDLDEAGYKVVVIGDENHPEIKAVVGCAKDVVVVGGEDDLDKLPKSGKFAVVGQTTLDPGFFADMLGAIARHGFSELRVVDTLCKEAQMRQKSAVELCQRVDIMFVLGGLQSANTRRLAELCKKYNEQTFHLQNWREFDKKILFGKKVAGVTAGASTPEWIIAEFVENLRDFEV